jgi:hypothetical protein
MIGVAIQFIIGSGESAWAARRAVLPDVMTLALGGLHVKNLGALQRPRQGAPCAAETGGVGPLAQLQSTPHGELSRAGIPPRSSHANPTRRLQNNDLGTVAGGNGQSCQVSTPDLAAHESRNLRLPNATTGGIWL